MSKRLAVSFGALAPGLTAQLGVPDSPQVRVWEEFRRALNLLRIHGVLTERESRMGEKRLLARIRSGLAAQPPLPAAPAAAGGKGGGG